MLIQFKLNAKAKDKSNADKYFPNGWLEITPDNRFIFTLDKAELGQNVVTSLTAIFAEELDIDYTQLEVRFPTLSNTPENPLYEPSWGTGGSSSVRSLWLPLRHAGAATRALFNEAAANHWGATVNQISHKNGVAFLNGTNKSLPYAGLLSIATHLESPEYQLKRLNDFKQLGRPLRRYDAKAKINGSTIYGIDKKIAGQKYAVLVRGPRLGAKPLSFDSTAIQTEIIDIVMIGNGVAVIADSIWEAQRASRKLEIKWQGGSSESSDKLARKLDRQLHVPGTLAVNKGDAEQAIANAEKIFKASYSVPLLAHAPMEPMNCTAWIHNGICEVWAPTQRPPLARTAARQASGLPIEKVVLHTVQIGGGFGRRLKQDYVTEAVEIAKQVAYPVQVIWSREEDMRYGFFRPAVSCTFSATLTKNGKIETWQHRIAALTNKINVAVQKGLSDRFFEALQRLKNRIFGVAEEGINNMPYSISNVRIEASSIKTDIPVGQWRSINHSYNAFFLESFIDELAHHAGKDPILFRLAHLQTEKSRLARTLSIAATRSQWGTTSSNGYSSGVACYSCFNSNITLIIKISIDYSGSVASPVLEQITCVADCGFVIDPDGVKAQLEGGILFGLNAALYGKIDIEDGQVMQSNFHDYPTLRMSECPTFDIYLIESDEPPGGVGELGTPPAAPALTNAWFAATKNRIRGLPLPR
ncbi:MAG: molybdopterin-dependent oxidoreductase [Gammaproteobacteria bacterium]|nr:molybdopterin-dependent oxidoreductase [Gammaproteobacteria bacterium]